MIVRETPEAFICIAQHDHATLSGQLAEHWQEDVFWKNDYTTDVVYAIYQHDRGWINLDAEPVWDEQHHKPYSFIGYPLNEKLQHYTLGIDQVQDINSYAAILCSRHYVSFMQASNAAEKAFVAHEQNRQATLKKQLTLNNPEKEALLTYHFHLLQFFDDLSLYLCINPPGVAKSMENPFFINGFKNSERFAFTGGKKIEACWKNASMVAVAPFPLAEKVEVAVPYKTVSKQEIPKQGLAAAYKNAPWQQHPVQVVPYL